MYFALGAAAAGALDMLSSLAASRSGAAKTTGSSQAASLFDTASTAAAAPAAQSSGTTRGGALASSTFNALIESQDPASRSDALKDLFAQLDADGDGKVTQSEFEDKLGAGGSNVAAADKVFAKLDADADGSVTIDELGSALKGRGHHHAAASRYHQAAQLGQPTTADAASTAQSSVSVTA